MESKKCKECQKTLPLSQFYKLEKWYRGRCKNCHGKKFQPASGKENTGRFKKGMSPPNPFKKGHIPWNKGKKGYHLQEKSFSTYRKKALAIYENKCEGCYKEINLHVHHIDHNRKNGAKENLMILCDKCHKKIHTLGNQNFSHYQSLLILRNYHEWEKKKL